MLPYYFILAGIGVNWIVSLLKERRLQDLFPLATGAVVACLSFGVLSSPLSLGNRNEQDSRSSAVVQLATFYGHQHYYSGSYAQALEEYQLAREADSTFPEVNLNLGACYLRLAMADSARYYLREEIHNHPKRVKGYTNLASLALVSKNYDEAFELSQQALSLRPFDRMSNSLMLRATALSGRFSIDSLVALADLAVNRCADNIFVVNEAAAALLSRKAQAEAEQLFLRAVLSQPPPIETDDGAFDFGFENSRSNWQKAKAAAYYKLGYLAGISGRIDDALTFCQEAIDHDSTLVQAWVNLANAHYSLGHRQTADSVLSGAHRRFGRAAIEQLLRQPALQ